MEESSDEKIERAKRLLKKYKNKQRQHPARTDLPNGFSTDPTSHHQPASNADETYSEVDAAESLDGSSTSHTHPPASTVSSYPALYTHQETTNTNGSNSLQHPPVKQQHLSPTNSLPRSSSESVMVASLQRSLVEREQTLGEVRARLQELHNHYSDLHAAYQLVSQSVESAAPKEFASQIGQLQTALAVAIDEKTSLQSQLRSATARLATLGEENQSLKHLRDTVTHSSSRNDSEIRHLSEEKTKLLETVSSQSAQLESQRRESSRMEAQILVIQQDRNEAQARLKHLYGEKRQADLMVEELRNELAMKEIYIKQLTMNSTEHQPAEDQMLIQRLIEERNVAGAKVETKKSELAELKKQLIATQSHYETCLTDVNDRLARLHVEVGEIKSSKAELQSAKNYLEEQLRLVRMQSETGEGEREVPNGEGKRPASNQLLMEFEAVKNSYEALEEEHKRSLAHVRELEELVGVKDERLNAYHNQLSEAQRRIEELERAQSLQSTISTDAVLLSQQLQNEKATVSRAVAQNVELKDQLAELQDKLVKVINESAEKETERISAVCEARELRQILESSASKDPSEVAVKVERPPTEEKGQQTTISAVQEEMADGVKAPLIPHFNGIANEEQIKEPSKEAQPSVTMPTEDTNSHDRNAHQSHQPVSPPPSSPPTSKHAEEREKPLEKPSLKPSEPESPKGRENAPAVKELERRLDEALKANTQFHLSNQQLQYWLTALETENESIGEYVALYRFQRSNVQRRLAEKEALLGKAATTTRQLAEQLRELQTAVEALASRKGVVQQAAAVQHTSSSSADGGEQSIDEAVETAVNKISDQMGAGEAEANFTQEEIADLLGLVERQRHNRAEVADGNMDPELEEPHHHGNGEGIQCNGCLECRGEMVEL